MASWLVPLNELTPEQRKAVEQDTAEPKVLVGAPGSGKTLVLVHRAKYLQERFNVSHDRFHIFVFTNVLKDYIRSSLHLLDIPESCVTTFDSWCIDYHKKNIGFRLPRTDNHIDFDAVKENVLDDVESNPDSTKLFDFILVDEGQDLNQTSHNILKRISQHITVCLDHKQQIYDERPEETEILQILNLRRRNVALLGAYRCCPYIVDLASEFIDDEVERQAFINQNFTDYAGRLTPLLYKAKNFDDEFERLAEVIRDRQMSGDKWIGILLPSKKYIYGMANDLLERRLNVEVQTKRETNIEKLDFNTINPKLMTYYSAKGLTFDSVILPRLSPAFFAREGEERLRRLIFVGITRAVDWVYMSTIAGKELPLLEELYKYEHEKKLTIQSWNDTQPVTSSLGNKNSEDDLDYPF
jgi:superfamily I DNA/RNA helicase